MPQLQLNPHDSRRRFADPELDQWQGGRPCDSPSRVASLYSAVMDIDRKEYSLNCRQESDQSLFRKQLLKNLLIQAQVARFLATKKLLLRVGKSLCRYKVERVEEQRELPSVTEESKRRTASKGRNLYKVKSRLFKEKSVGRVQPEPSPTVRTDVDQLDKQVAKWFLIGLRGGRRSLRNYDFWARFKRRAERRPSRGAEDDVYFKELVVRAICSNERVKLV